MTLFRTADEAEPVLRRWYQTEFGEQDATLLLDWVWRRERNGARYIAALTHIARETERHGKAFVGRLLAHARRPEHLRDAEEALLEAMRPHVERARTTILGHRGDPVASEAALRELRVRLRELVHRTYPDKHRATIDGAILVATLQGGAGAVIDFRALVDALNNVDPLAATAASSHAVTDDR